MTNKMNDIVEFLQTVGYNEESALMNGPILLDMLRSGRPIPETALTGEEFEMFKSLVTKIDRLEKLNILL